MKASQKKRRMTKTGRIRPLGGMHRAPSGKINPVKPQGSGKSYTEKFHAAFKRTERKRIRREEQARYLKEKARKDGSTREENHEKANAERARVRAEREAQRRGL